MNGKSSLGSDCYWRWQEEEAMFNQLATSGSDSTPYRYHNEAIVMLPPNSIRILSVENHPVFREGLRTIIESQAEMFLVGEATNGEEAVASFRRHRPDVTLMELRLGSRNGLDTLVAIRQESPKARIIILTSSDSCADIQRAMRAGASAYILKSMAKNELLGVIRSVHAGKRYVPAEVAAKFAEHLGDDDLTNRELEVLHFIRDGYRNKQIAGQLIDLCISNRHYRS